MQRNSHLEIVKSVLIFYAKRVAFNEKNKRATIGIYKSRFSLGDQFLVDFYRSRAARKPLALFTFSSMLVMVKAE
jgi:hypothetical protein